MIGRSWIRLPAVALPGYYSHSGQVVLTHSYMYASVGVACKWSSQCWSIGLVTFMLRVRISPRQSASNLEQTANLLCAQANSASYPQRDGKWVVAHGLRGEGRVCWLGRWYVCVLHRGSNCSPSRAMDGRIMRHGIMSSCQSAATSEIVKRCWSWV